MGNGKQEGETEGCTSLQVSQGIQQLGASSPELSCGLQQRAQTHRPHGLETTPASYLDPHGARTEAEQRVILLFSQTPKS